MKIKHWQGYGSLDYTVLKKSAREIIVKVSGMHECGCACDTYHAKDWLFDRIVKNNKINYWDLFIVVSDYDDYAIYSFVPKFGRKFAEINSAA